MNTCLTCGKRLVRHGKDRKGQQRWRCKSCKVTTIDQPADNFRGRLSLETETAIAELLANGVGVRSIARKVGVKADTVSKRRAALVEQQLATPIQRARRDNCHYCGKRVNVKKNFQRAIRRTQHQFCDTVCYQRFRLVTDEARLLRNLENILKYQTHGECDV